jgi:type 1 glutamine amidotransferase
MILGQVNARNEAVIPIKAYNSNGQHVEFEATGDVEMPVVCTKMYGEGRVFYSSIGHNAATVREPDPLRILVRGLLWAAHAEDRA